MISGRRHNRLWALLATVTATVPVAGMFSLSRIFFVRDLTMAFRSRFQFLRHSVFSGSWPLWDPYSANGQAAVTDALYQMFHLPSLLVRLLLPEVIAYNAWVALPVPVAAAGMYLFLRRHVSAPAGCLGSVAFALAGPIVSTTNFPNMSWSVAAMPYVFWALERLLAKPSAAEIALVASMVGCQALAGEPVTLAATLATGSAYAVLPERRWRNVRLVALVAAGIGAGLLLASIQFLPLIAAARGSMRGMNAMPDFWAFHPLALVELLVPHFFGDYFNSNLRELAWMVALNSQRDPFYYTMYVGVPVLLLASVAAFSRRPRTAFWAVALAVCALASLGPYTPFYPALRALVPPLRSFRFPVKYLSLFAFGVATLASMTLQWLIDGDAPRRTVRWVLGGACAVSLLTYVTIAWVLLAPRLPVRAFFHLAVWARVPTPIQGAEFLIFRARPLLTSLLLKTMSAAFLLWVAASSRRERRLALGTLALFAAVDLLVSNSSVNPVMDARLLDAPQWTRHIPPDLHERVYVGGRLEGYVNTTDVDAPRYATYLDEYPEREQRYLVVTQFLFHTSGARIRDALSYDLPVLWPTDYARVVGRFKSAPREDRLRYLSRAGVRYVVLPTPPYPGAQPIARLIGADQLQLYDFNPGARRTYVVPDALLGPDVKWQIEGLFQPRFNPADGVLVSEPPPLAAGVEGPPVPASAVFLEDGLNRVVIRAGLPADGYLALLDSYDPNWSVEVDGSPTVLMRANAIFRAVHLTRGRHLVTFTYRPRLFYVGAGVSVATALALALAVMMGARRAPGARGA